MIDIGIAIDIDIDIQCQRLNARNTTQHIRYQILRFSIPVLFDSSTLSFSSTCLG
jgi:hypothetical protein